MGQMRTSSKRSSHEKAHYVKRHKSFKRTEKDKDYSRLKATKSLQPQGSPIFEAYLDDASLNDNQDNGNYSSSDSNEAGKLSPYSTLLATLQSGKRQRKVGNGHGVSKDYRAYEPFNTQSLLETSPQHDNINSDSSEEDVDFEKNGAGNEDALISSDPYYWHFINGFPDVASRLAAVKTDSWTFIKLSSEEDLCIRVDVPKTANAKSTFDGNSPLPNNLWLKCRLFKYYEAMEAPVDVHQSQLSKYLFRYYDILYGSRITSTANSLRFISCLHALNHVYKTRDRVLKNSEKRAHMESGQDIEMRDQGFTRPKVLFLLETRQNCYKYASVISLLAKPEQEEHKKRFIDNFYLPENKFSLNDPEDFRELFEGNDDNNFRLGLKLTRKTIKYFANFYSADIIFASPLGLRSAIEAKGRKDYDFLSSIEILFIDQADAMIMQNWEHVEFVLDHLNIQPKEAHGCDFSRLRNWYLDGDSQYYRQTIVFSAFITPDLGKIFSKRMKNVAGKIKFHPTYHGALLDLDIQVKQTFYKLSSSVLEKEPDVRFEMFTTGIMPSIAKSSMQLESNQAVLVFIPSYLDFVRIRNFMSSSSMTHNLSFGAISEYSEHAEVRRARSLFVSGRHKVLLYTGRAHHFRRYHLKGVKEVIMYALPDNANFYRDIVGGYIGSSITSGQIDNTHTKVRVLFSKWDAFKLERIVGSARTKKMLYESLGDVFEFR